jgi:hypothetical protein
MRREGAWLRGALVAATVAAAAALAACDGPSTGPKGVARVTILLTDAPGGIAEAWVNIGGIYLQGPMDGLAGGEERVWLRESPTGWIDLMTLSGQWMTLVENAAVPAGTYSQLRFVILEAVLVTDGGSAYVTDGADLDALNAARGGAALTVDGRLNCPSCGQSGLKVKYQGGVMVLEDQTILAADFDVSQSFGREAGMAGRWVMHPVIHVAEMDMTGSVAGTVALGPNVQMPSTCGANDVSLSLFVPVAINGASDVFSGSVAGDGSYTIGPLAPGGYSLFWEPEIQFNDGSELEFSQVSIQTDPATDPPTVTVVAGGIASADYTILEVGCNPGT